MNIIFPSPTRFRRLKREALETPTRANADPEIKAEDLAPESKTSVYLWKHPYGNVFVGSYMRFCAGHKPTKVPVKAIINPTEDLTSLLSFIQRRLAFRNKKLEPSCKCSKSPGHQCACGDSCKCKSK